MRNESNISRTQRKKENKTELNIKRRTRKENNNHRIMMEHIRHFVDENNDRCHRVKDVVSFDHRDVM